MSIDQQRMHTTGDDHLGTARAQLAGIRLHGYVLVAKGLGLGELVDIVIVRATEGQLTGFACAPHE